MPLRMREEKLKVYDALVTKCSRFKHNDKTMPYTSANGYMFSLFNKACEIGIRFSKEVQEKFLTRRLEIRLSLATSSSLYIFRNVLPQA